MQALKIAAHSGKGLRDIPTVTHKYTQSNTHKCHWRPTAHHSKQNSFYFWKATDFQGEQQCPHLYLTPMELVTYKENSSDQDSPVKKAISPCPGGSQSESRSHLVSCVIIIR